MELVDQHTKKIMEGCKERAHDAGLSFENETLEYIVTNRDLIELNPKLMIPTLYDYWVHDVEVLREKSRYELYPSNPYETVINTRPAISFYNDNNPDWMNVMIFYHVIAHIDFFQNNLYFSRTWNYDFNGQALSDKRLIAKLRSEKGRWVDYIIEFGRGIDNIVGYYSDLSRTDFPDRTSKASALDYYFDVFLQQNKKVKIGEYLKEVERYNELQEQYTSKAEETFFAGVYAKYPEFRAVYEKSLEDTREKHEDILQFLMEHSAFLKKDENIWMNSVLQVIRNTSLFFQPQIRTKIMNEGWASYWHEKLFLTDDRIKGKEIAFARTHAGVTSLPRVGINPYALGLRLFQYIEDLKNTGRYSLEFQKLRDVQKREQYRKESNDGRDFIFEVREKLCDHTFINNFVDQDFVNLNKLFVAGKRLNKEKMVWEYYVKSRKAEDYRAMIEDSLYHPPYIDVDIDKCKDDMLYLVHHFEGKPLVQEFISNTMMGIEYLWGDGVQLETSEVESIADPQSEQEGAEPQITWQRVVYTMKDRKLSKMVLQ